ncbi:MAG: AAA family ATPase [Flavobacteriia bacterium]|nr:AAA family ATPase [Flavobacteriia bacterium]
MEDHTLNSLREALSHSPENVPLRLMLAEHLVLRKMWHEAETEFTEVLKLANNTKAKAGLAKAYFELQKFSGASVILEELIDSGLKDAEIHLLYAEVCMKEHEAGKAVEHYLKAKEINPNIHSEELEQTLKVPNAGNDEDLDDFELESKSRFLQKPDLKFEDVGGMDAMKQEIELKIIKPLLHPELFKSYGKKIGGGILMYGPPGCGKTYIAKATAGEVNAKFINVGLSDILDMWIGNSEKNLHELFEIARNNTPCVIFIDEVDALGASRYDMKHSSSRHVINQFLTELDGVEYDNEGVLVIGATNAPWSVDSAFRRPGRFDRVIFVPPPDTASIEAILKIKLEDKPTKDVNYGKIASKLDGYSGADVDAIIDIAIEEKLLHVMNSGKTEPITTKDLLKAASKHKPSTREWFSTAKNYVAFSNESGAYNDVKEYMNKRKF